jgi:flagellar protein FliL
MMSEKTKTILLSVFTFINFCVLGGGTYLVYASTLGYESPVITEESLRKVASLPEKFNEGSLVYSMDKLVVNLSGEPRRTIRIQVNLDMINAESFENIMDNENRSRARDRIKFSMKKLLMILNRFKENFF